MNTKERKTTEREIFYSALRAHKSKNCKIVLDVIKAKGTLNGGDIQKALRMGGHRFSQPQVSHYCKALIMAGLVFAVSKGKERYYSISENTIKQQLKRYVDAI